MSAALQSPLICHPAPLRGLAVTRLGPEPWPVVPILGLFPWSSVRLPRGVRSPQTSLRWQPGTQRPLTEHWGFEAAVWRAWWLPITELGLGLPWSAAVSGTRASLRLAVASWQVAA